MRTLLAIFAASSILLASKLPITIDNASNYPLEEIVTEIDASRVVGTDPGSEAFGGMPTLSVLLKPYETLVLEAEQNAGDVSLYLSEDGALSRRIAWDAHGPQLRYRSTYEKDIVLTLAGEMKEPYTLLRISSQSPLEALVPVESREYFVPKGAYADLAVPKAGIWRLEHKIAFEKSYPKARKAYRLAIQKGEAPYTFETHTAYADESPDAKLSAERFSHPLYTYLQSTEAEKLRVHAQQDTWLRFEHFGDDVLLSRNSLHLNEELNVTLLNTLGERDWSNREREAGLQQYRIYQDALAIADDPALKSRLEKLSRRSVLMKPLYPVLTTYEDGITQGRYSIASLHMYEEQSRPERSDTYAMERAEKMPEGFFVPIPRQKSQEEFCQKSAPTTIITFEQKPLSASDVEKRLADVVDYKRKAAQYHLYVHEGDLETADNIEPLTDAARVLANTLLRMGVQKENIYYHTLANYPGGEYYLGEEGGAYVTLRVVYEEETVGTLLYDSDVAELTASQKQKIRTLARLYSDETAQIHLFGHTDAVASKAYNTELARNRARGIAQFLASEGVAPEKLFVHASQEVKQAVRTPDEHEESYNRRVVMTVVNNYSNRCELALRYSLHDAQYPSSVELTLHTKGKEPYRFKMEDNRGDVREFVYTPSLNTEAVREDIRREAYYGRSEEARSALDGLLEDTATITVPVAAGVSSLTFWSEQDSGGKLGLRYLQPKSYRDERANTGLYSGTLTQFFASLKDESPTGDASWQEQTGPLREWLQNRHDALLEQINPAAKLLLSDLDLADRLRADNEAFKAKQIYRHFLLLSDDSSKIKRAYDALSTLSGSDEERRSLDAVWIYRMHDEARLLELIAQWLDEEKNDLAQRALLLYEEDAKVASLGVRLAYRVRDWQMFDRYAALLEGESAAYWQQCRDDYGEHGAVCEGDQPHNTSGLRMLTRMIGANRIESVRTGSASSYAQVRPNYPLHFTSEANTTVRFNIRLKEPADERLWATLTSNGESYALPLFKTAVQPSLRSGSGEHIGMSNVIDVHFESAKPWQLEVPDAALVSMTLLNASQTTSRDSVAISNNEDVHAWLNAFDPAAATYADALKLLWVFDHYYRLREPLFAKAVMAEERSRDARSIAIYKKIALMRSMRPFEELRSDAGSVLLEEAVEENEDAVSLLRTRVIGSQERPQLLLHDARVRVFEFDVRRSKHIRLDMRYFISPFIAEAGEQVEVYVQLDNREKERFLFDSAQSLQQYEKRLYAGRHILRCWIETPKSERYIGVDLYENGKRHVVPVKRVFHLATDAIPVVLRSSRPLVIKAVKKEDDGVTQSYHYLDGDESRELALHGDANGTLYRFYELRFDPHYTQIASEDAASAEEKKRTTAAAAAELAPIARHSKRRTRQSEDATYSAEGGVFHPNTLDEDRLESSQSLQAQLGLLRHERLSRNDYVRLHWFTRVYDKPLLALQHRWEHLFERYPVTLDMDLNGYFQHEGTLHSGYYAKADGYYRLDIAQKSYAKLGVSMFHRSLDVSLPDAQTLDPLLYTQYKADHSSGVTGYATGYYRPYLDTQGVASVALRSNENLTLDHLKVDVKWQQLYFPAEFDIGYGYRYFLEDRDRRTSQQTHLLKLGGGYERFLDMRRAELSFSLQKELSSSAFGLALMFTWHFSENDRYRHFMPSEIPFRTMKYIQHHGQHNE